MSDELDKNTVFESMRILQENTICFDCGQGKPSRASVAHSSFICITCASQHRGLGVNLSGVKSLTRDEWNDTQLRQLLIGGNDKLREYFAKYGLNEVKEIKLKYITMAAQYYRRRNKAIALGEPFGQAELSFKEGR